MSSGPETTRWEGLCDNRGIEHLVVCPRVKHTTRPVHPADPESLFRARYRRLARQHSVFGYNALRHWHCSGRESLGSRDAAGSLRWDWICAGKDADRLDWHWGDGPSMCGHLIAAGYQATVYNRTPDKASTLVEKGARLAGSRRRAWPRNPT